MHPTRLLRSLFLTVAVLFATALPAHAQQHTVSLQGRFALEDPLFVPGPSGPGSAMDPQRPVVYSYSDAYYIRLKIHKYASLATVPLFVGEYLVGKQLYDGNTSGGTRSLHEGLASGVAALFGVNTVTGVWNLWESRENPNGRTSRYLHSILMLAADAGFLATAATAPDDEGVYSRGDYNRHRTIAVSSMALATVGYLYMLIRR